MELITYTISGTDSASFLQGLLTCDVNTLNNSPLLAACCNQKGRIVANFWIQRQGDVFYLTLPKSMVSILQNHLQKYILRSHVQLTTIDQPVLNQNNQQLIWILPATSEQFTPQMIDLEKQGGVSFKKGCYLGQEIIARTEHLGQLKRHLYKIIIDNGSAVKISDVIKDSAGQKMGIVIAINKDGIFAVIEDRAIDRALMINDIQITKIKRNR